MTTHYPDGISPKRLEQITDDACQQYLGGADAYVHSSTQKWNSDIINAVLQKVISETTPKEANQPQYKYAVNSTIVQHAVPAPGADPASAGRRGMHSATGAFWNDEKDGMWSHKWQGKPSQGMDVVISIFWFST